MPIDPNAVQWDDAAPADAVSAPSSGAIDVNAVQWDSEPSDPAADTAPPAGSDPATAAAFGNAPPHDYRLPNNGQPVDTAPVKRLPQLPEKGEHPAKKYIRTGFARGLLDPVTAAGQVLENTLPESATKALTAGDQWLYENTGGLLGHNAPTYGEALKQEEAAYQQQRAAEGETGIDADRIAGNIVATSLPMARGAKILSGAGYGAKTIGAALGASGGLLTPTQNTDEGFLEEKAAQIGGGALAGLAIPALGSALGSVVMPKAAQNEALQTVLKEGGKPTIGQALGGRWNVAEEKAMSLPIMGDMISVARKGAIESIEPAAYNRALSAIGKKLPEGLKGRDALVHTENALKQQYDDVLGKIGAVIPDEQFAKKVDSLQGMVDSLKMPQAQKDKFLFALDKVKSSVDENGVMTSDAFKRLESSLGSQAKKLGQSTDIYEMEMAPAVGQLREELRGMLSRQSGQYAKELQNVNKGWANFKVVQNAAGKIGAEEGAFTPAQLQAAVRAADKSKDKGAFARGNALMQDLAESSKTVLGDKVPNSFTADRALFSLGALGSGAVNPAIPVGLGIGAGAYTRPVQNAMVSMVAKRPELARELARAIESGVSDVTAPAAIAAPQLLRGMTAKDQ